MVEGFVGCGFWPRDLSIVGGEGIERDFLKGSLRGACIKKALRVVVSVKRVLVKLNSGVVYRWNATIVRKRLSGGSGK